MATSGRGGEGKESKRPCWGLIHEIHSWVPR